VKEMKYEYEGRQYDENEELDIRLLKKIRRQIDKDQCVDCGTPFNLTLHHILPRRKDGKDTIANTNMKCRECHDDFHKEEVIIRRMRRERLEEIKASFTYEELHPEIDMIAVIRFFLWIRLICEQNYELAKKHPYAKYVKDWGVKH
jgi:hypothetical protein